MPNATTSSAVVRRRCFRRLYCRSMVVMLVLLFNSAVVHGADVAVLLSANAPAFRGAIDGFKKAHNHRIVGVYDMKGDFKRGKALLQEIESEAKPDVIYAVGIWALQLVQKEKPSTPVVYSMVLNPATIVGEQPKNITGASMNVSVKETFALLKQMNPNLKRIGTIFTSATTGHLVEDAKKAAQELSIDLVAEKISSPREAIPALGRLQKKGIEVLWLVPDKALSVPTVSKQLMLYSYRNRVPLVGFSKAQAAMGSLVSVSFSSSEDIGAQAGELANALISGKSAEDLPFTKARKISFVINMKTAKRLGISVPSAVLSRAENVIK